MCLIRRALASAFVIFSASVVSAADLAFADFATYSDGALVGQNDWQQYATQTARPLTVATGSVSWLGGSVDNGQDAMLAFAEQVVQPTEGSTILWFDVQLRVTANAGTNPSYFAALNTLTTTSTSGNFQNARLVARSAESGFQFGTRVNGQSGYPFAYGDAVLSYGTTYAVRQEIHMVTGNANDFINLYVGPDFDNLSLYATAAYSGTGTVADPLFGAMLLSQFGSASTQEAGVSFDVMRVAVVPEPSTYALACVSVGLLGALARGRSRRTTRVWADV